MKAKFTFTLLLLVFATSSFAQQTPQLTDTQLEELAQQRFTIEMPGLQILTDSGDEVLLGYSRHWVPYRGYERISEARFFELTGNSELAAQAKRSHRNKMLLMGLGGLSVITGAVLLARDNSTSDGFGFNVGPKITGGLLLTLGGGTMGFTAVSMRQRKAPYWIAEDIAQSYNASLDGERN